MSMGTVLGFLRGSNAPAGRELTFLFPLLPDLDLKAAFYPVGHFFLGHGRSHILLLREVGASLPQTPELRLAPQVICVP